MILDGHKLDNSLDMWSTLYKVLHLGPSNTAETRRNWDNSCLIIAEILSLCKYCNVILERNKLQNAIIITRTCATKTYKSKLVRSIPDHSDWFCNLLITLYHYDAT
ncbi:uncharacterized protein LOC116300280 [Actinia tenebrosa]|uniref:Uncharacterized protein LOC116300280 n=1 Tax=Actinia tenebrosa TaxID=6105 RepID=A0A6P8IA61_ACTTE|nr:uncharacterized protein LOC116300280 [Actinia tenebrosa]